MLISAAKAVMAMPEGLLPTEGFGRQISPLYVRAVLFDGRERNLLVSVEMTSLPDEEIRELKKQVSASSGLQEDHCFICVTHTFSVPHILPEAAVKTNEDRVKRDALRKALHDAVRRASEGIRNNRKEGQLFFGSAPCTVNRNRDFETPDGWWIGNQGDGYSDHELYVIRVSDENENTLAYLVNYAVQSSVLDGSEIQGRKAVSGDLAGELCRRMEEENPGAVAIFVPGAAGDQAPRNKAVTVRWNGGMLERSDEGENGIRICRELAAEMTDAAMLAARKALPLKDSHVRLWKMETDLPGKRLPKDIHQLKPTHCFDLSETGKRKETITLLRFGTLAIFGIRPELNSITAEKIRKRIPGADILVFTMFDGGAKYLADAASCERITYEAMNSGFAAGAEKIFTDAAVKLFRKSEDNDMKEIDFSSKHNILLEDEDGKCQPMDVPYFKSTQIARGTWQILSDGDFSYLLEGDEESFLIDCGYGAGNIREYAQSLTKKPLRNAANTHDHFDHTANNGYFDCIYLSEETKALATIPSPSFEGITFPRDYRTEVVGDGDVIPIKGRELLVFEIPDHAVGSLAFLDRKERILFSGDEITRGDKHVNGSVEHWNRMLEKIVPYRKDFDTICAGPEMMDASVFDHQKTAAEYILAGHEGISPEPVPFHPYEKKDAEGRLIWKRKLPHPGDLPKDFGRISEWDRELTFEDYTVVYDCRKITDGGNKNDY